MPNQNRKDEKKKKEKKKYDDGITFGVNMQRNGTSKHTFTAIGNKSLGVTTDAKMAK